MCSTGGRPAIRSSQLVYMVLGGREAAREAETGRVFFASMSVVINGHVFVENGLRGAVQWDNKDAGHLADGQTIKICAIQKHRCFAFYTRSLWGSQNVHFLRIYMATARLRGLRYRARADRPTFCNLVGQIALMRRNFQSERIACAGGKHFQDKFATFERFYDTKVPYRVSSKQL